MSYPKVKFGIVPSVKEIWAFRKNPLSIHNNYKFSSYILYVTMVALPLVVESCI